MRTMWLLFLLGAAMASAGASTSSSQGINFTSQYWTAFLNISYVDPERQVWHTERSETGRFGSSGVKEAAGVAVEVLSSVQNSKSRNERNIYAGQGIMIHEKILMVISYSWDLRLGLRLFRESWAPKT